MGIDSLFDNSKSLNLPLREVENEENIKKYYLDITDEEFAKRLCEANKLYYIPENTECLLTVIRILVNKCIEKELIEKDFKIK